MTGARRKSFDNVSNYSSSMVSQSNGKVTTNDKQLVSMKPGGESSRRILPGIGLHLNALATTSKDYKIIKNENLASGRELNFPSSNASIHSPTAGQGTVYESFPSASSERDMDGTESGVQLLQDASQASALLANEDLNQNSPKKKRHVLLTRYSSLNYQIMLVQILVSLCVILHFYLDLQTQDRTHWRR